MSVTGTDGVSDDEGVKLGWFCGAARVFVDAVTGAEESVGEVAVFAAGVLGVLPIVITITLVVESAGVLAELSVVTTLLGTTIVGIVVLGLSTIFYFLASSFSVGTSVSLL